MSENERRSRAEIEQTVATLFEAAGYEVSQSVGSQPGEVDWFARPKTGLVRPTSYFRVWETCPEELDVALHDLESARQAKAVEQALGVVMQGTPAEYSTTFGMSPSSVVSYRRLVLEISGIADEVRAHVQSYEAKRGPFRYLPRSIHDSVHGDVDAVDWLKQWVQSKPQSSVVLLADDGIHREAALQQVIYELGKDFVRAPDADVPLVAYTSGTAAWIAYASDFAIHAHTNLDELLDESHISLACLSRLAIKDYEKSALRHLPGDYQKVLAPSSANVERWFDARMIDRASYSRFAAVRRHNPEFLSLSNAPANAEFMVDAMLASQEAIPSSVPQWTAFVIHRYVSSVLRAAVPKGLSVSGWAQLEDAALSEFSLGRAGVGEDFWSFSARRWSLVRDQLVTWAIEERNDKIRLNTLIRDYFIARRVAREVAEGEFGSLSRHQFPREYVLLFLSILSPEASARFAEGRGTEIRAEIESEIERRLQLTLAHLLKRSAGAIRLNVGLIQDGIQAADAASFHQEFSRIEEELSLQSALAEQTGRWQEVPNGTPEGLVLQEIVSAAAGPIQKKYPAVVCEIEVPALLRVRASRVGLREILHCLIENAFHAVAFFTDSEPHISIRAAAEGDTVRLEIVDNGPGIRPEDRERIFEPYVTTKKDVGRPFGTGLGLAIARRYAAKIGAHVALDADRPETCFVVRFVTWREPS